MTFNFEYLLCRNEQIITFNKSITYRPVYTFPSNEGQPPFQPLVYITRSTHLVALYLFFCLCTSQNQDGKQSKDVLKIRRYNNTSMFRISYLVEKNDMNVIEFLKTAVIIQCTDLFKSSPLNSR